MVESIKDKNAEIVSKRWARALYELASENDSISKQEVLLSLKDVASAIKSSEELSNMFLNPSISTEEKQAVLCKLFQNSVMPIVYNFLYALNLKKRINLIQDIAENFEQELNMHNNIKHATITSAIELNEEKKNEIKARITEKINKELIVNWNVDANIIAGLIFNIDETVIDGSVKHKLEDISRKIGVDVI